MAMLARNREQLEVPIPYIFLAYFLGLNFREYPTIHMAKNMVQYLHFRILEISH